MKTTIIAILVLFMTDALICQLPNYAWRLQNPGVSPSPREEHAMAWHPGSQRVVMFGGLGTTALSDTWTWTGNSWHLESPIASPSPRYGHAMALDRATGHVLLFGGTDGTQSFDDTWLWNGTSWLQQVVAVRPSPRWNSAMSWTAYYGGGVILFGGRSGSVDIGDTWRWGGADWSLVPTAHAPSSRSGHVMVERRANGDGWIMLHGGSSGASEVWRLYAGDWEMMFATAAGARVEGAATYDTTLDRAVLFGGSTDCRVWTYEGPGSGGQDWVHTAAPCGPAGRMGHAIACDELRSSVLVFGGSNGEGDTWTVGRLPFIQAPVGFGCGGAMGGLYGNPTEVRWAMHDPWLSSSSGASVHAFQVGLVAFGVSSLPQSINLSQVAALPISCNLHVYPDVVEYCLSPIPGNWDLLLPGIPSGITDLFAQGFMVGIGSYPGALYLSATPAFKIL